MNEAKKIDNQQGNGVLPCVSGSLSIDDLHFKLRTIFFFFFLEHWVDDDDMIYMDYVSDAFEEKRRVFLDDCH